MRLQRRPAAVSRAEEVATQERVIDRVDDTGADVRELARRLQRGWKIGNRDAKPRPLVGLGERPMGQHERCCKTAFKDAAARDAIGRLYSLHRHRQTMSRGADRLVSPL